MKSMDGNRIKSNRGIVAMLALILAIVRPTTTPAGCAIAAIGIDERLHTQTGWSDHHQRLIPGCMDLVHRHTGHVCSSLSSLSRFILLIVMFVPHTQVRTACVDHLGSSDVRCGRCRHHDDLWWLLAAYWYTYTMTHAHAYIQSPWLSRSFAHTNICQ